MSAPTLNEFFSTTHNVSTLADAYLVGRQKMGRLIKALREDPEIAKEFGKRMGHLFTPKQVEIIVRELGTPPAVKKDE